MSAVVGTLTTRLCSACVVEDHLRPGHVHPEHPVESASVQTTNSHLARRDQAERGPRKVQLALRIAGKPVSGRQTARPSLVSKATILSSSCPGRRRPAGDGHDRSPAS